MSASLTYFKLEAAFPFQLIYPFLSPFLAFLSLAFKHLLNISAFYSFILSPPSRIQAQITSGFVLFTTAYPTIGLLPLPRLGLNYLLNSFPFSIEKTENIRLEIGRDKIARLLPF